MRVIHVAGARPNFMKIAPLMEAVVHYNREHTQRPMEQFLVHTGQHYDEPMSKLFFDELGISKPDVNLEVGSASHARQTAEIMKRFEPVVEQWRPDVVSVVGDVNSTAACAMTAAKMGIRTAHVEAGLRSHDREMPEEINRLVTDALSDFLFATSRGACENLRREGIPDEKIFFVGNTMIDTLMRHRELARRPAFLDGRSMGQFAVVTLHRPSNVDQPRVFEEILDAFEELGKRIPIIFSVHPRTRDMAEKFGLLERMERQENLTLTDPLGYLEFLYLLAHASFAMTDSGGIQEETTALGIPCLTIRENTERPETVKEGTNVLVGANHARIVREGEAILEGRGKRGRIPEKWDGRAAQRIVRVLAELAD
ncbi:MAG: UDP-N-acetylglucosamine 2-epimerase (non-hydrolyzing) [Acidobacteriota bacterium]|nr:MAG: UDP-N-acetylglucosamine 2-epimerase (non-hydrolyzing) [Acidobacteriota bacterium]